MNQLYGRAQPPMGDSQLRQLMGLIRSTSPQQAREQVQRLIRERGITQQEWDATAANLGTQNALGQANISQQISETSCATQRAIDGVNYNMATQAAGINQNTTEQTQKILDAITGNRMAAMQNEINQLQLNAALCGVVRYPNATTYTAGFNPYSTPQACGCAAPAF